MTRISMAIAAGLIGLPAAAFAQNGNVYNGTAHEPSAAPTQQDERAAGVAPTQQQNQAENHDLAVIGNQLQQRASRDAQSVPLVGKSIYGTQPDGSIQITPNNGGGAAGGGGAGGGGAGGGGAGGAGAR